MESYQDGKRRLDPGFDRAAQLSSMFVLRGGDNFGYTLTLGENRWEEFLGHSNWWFKISWFMYGQYRVRFFV